MAAAKTRKPKKIAEDRWRRFKRHPRLLISAALFIVLEIAFIIAGLEFELGMLLAFDIAAVVFLGSTLQMILTIPLRSVRTRARREDQGYWGFLLTGAAVAAVALVALGMELNASKEGGASEVFLAVWTLLVTWLFLNKLSALHYAQEFYGDTGGPNRGLEFPGTKEPDYWDFMYFSFVLGMTFQVSDVDICDRRIRRVVLAQSIIAFFFNVIIIALTVNVVAGSA